MQYRDNKLHKFFGIRIYQNISKLIIRQSIYTEITKMQLYLQKTFIFTNDQSILISNIIISEI
jgi:hypothetical protein